MSSEEMRKLKRGLADISPLFGPEPPERTEPSKPEPALSPFEILSVHSPDCPGDSLFLNTLLASQLISQNKSCSILSVQAEDRNLQPPSIESESFGENLKRLNLSWEQLEQISAQPQKGALKGLSPSGILFLDVAYAVLPVIDKIVPFLDKWVLLLRPSLESLTEAYKLMKASSILNKHLEYFILFEGHPTDKKAGLLFERLSDMVAHRLGIHLYWLGFIHLTRHSQRFVTELDLNHLFLRSSRKVASLEKAAVAGFIQSLSLPAAGSLS